LFFCLSKPLPFPLWQVVSTHRFGEVTEQEWI